MDTPEFAKRERGEGGTCCAFTGERHNAGGQFPYFCNLILRIGQIGQRWQARLFFERRDSDRKRASVAAAVPAKSKAPQIRHIAHGEAFDEETTLPARGMERDEM